MKTEDEIYQEYKRFYLGPWLFGRNAHWKGYFEGYEMGYQDAIEECQKSLIKDLGIDLENFPTEVDEQFEVIKKALTEYYENKHE